MNDRPILFFDGVCGLCNRFVDFLMRRDRRAAILMAPLQGETAARHLEPAEIESLQSVVLLVGGAVYRRSSAVVRVLWRLGPGWKLLGTLLWVIPLPLRDAGYDVVARRRHRWFGQRDTCRMPTEQERHRLLP